MVDHLAAYGRYYKKALACLVGVSFILLFRYLDIEVPGLNEAVLEAIVGLLTVLSVERVSNGPKPEQADDEFRGEL